jgi:hypothetical protein
VQALLDGGPEREELDEDGDAQDGEGHAGALDLMGVAQLLDALVQGEQPTEGEEDQGHHERPEVAFAAEPEGMVGRGRLAGPGSAQEQQALVPGVGDGVDGLGQHGGRAGDEEPDELGHRDGRVGQERGEDGLLAAFLHGGGC